MQANNYFFAEMMCKQLIFCVKTATRLIAYNDFQYIDNVQPNTRTLFIFISVKSSLELMLYCFIMCRIKIKLRRAEGSANIFGLFRVKNHDFTPKIIFFPILGGGAYKNRFFLYLFKKCDKIHNFMHYVQILLKLMP